MERSLEDDDLIPEPPLGSLTIVEWPEGGSGILRDAWKFHCIVGWTPTHYYPASGSRRMSVGDIKHRLIGLGAHDSARLVDERPGLPEDEHQMYADTLYAMALRSRGL